MNSLQNVPAPGTGPRWSTTGMTTTWSTPWGLPGGASGSSPSLFTRCTPSQKLCPCSCSSTSRTSTTSRSWTTQLRTGATPSRSSSRCSWGSRKHLTWWVLNFKCKFIHKIDIKLTCVLQLVLQLRHTAFWFVLYLWSHTSITENTIHRKFEAQNIENIRPNFSMSCTSTSKVHRKQNIESQ